MAKKSADEKRILEASGNSLNGFIVRAVNEKLERDTQTSTLATGTGNSSRPEPPNP
jgi:hypothetical protein